MKRKTAKTVYDRSTIEAHFGKHWGAVCDELGLIPVEVFYRKLKDRSSYIAINEKGECFVWVTPKDTKPRKVSVLESVLFFAREGRYSYEGSTFDEGRYHWMMAVA